MHTDPHNLAVHLVDQLRDGEVRAVFRALIRDARSDAEARLRAAVGSAADELDLADPMALEWLLEALEDRISPPDEDDLGITRPTGSVTVPFDRLAA